MIPVCRYIERTILQHCFRVVTHSELKTALPAVRKVLEYSCGNVQDNVCVRWERAVPWSDHQITEANRREGAAASKPAEQPSSISEMIDIRGVLACSGK